VETTYELGIISVFFYPKGMRVSKGIVENGYPWCPEPKRDLDDLVDDRLILTYLPEDTIFVNLVPGGIITATEKNCTTEDELLDNYIEWIWAEAQRRHAWEKSLPTYERYKESLPYVPPIWEVFVPVVIGWSADEGGYWFDMYQVNDSALGEFVRINQEGSADE
jgi:hypothetical protein